ncbi:polysaccharide deacetylase [Nitzschia inconspicua]|uniref:Polysaccharide deacetylase n=1 Tax=Nitzschia inconspicua TaxID=303405 RepID=A0A9K3LG53_9STRA|nr:polysaccharide deacetylase [Nitzschia inconspicua]
MMTIQTKVLYVIWDIATRIGMRRLGRCLQGTLPGQYQDSVFFLDNIEWQQDQEDSIDEQQSRQGYIALTIDDGICRTKGDHSMIHEVCELLDRYQNSKATFFVCTDYTTPEDAFILLDRGHELGNHLQKDISNYYCNLSQREFERELVQATHHLEDILSQHRLRHIGSQSNYPSNKIRWFRAPQGRMSLAMSKALKNHEMINVMGDVYCDDWAFCEAVDGKDPDVQKQIAATVADLLLRQVQPHSIAIFHMPERHFREASLLALEKFLKGCQRRNLKCVTMSQLAEHP